MNTMVMNINGHMVCSTCGKYDGNHDRKCVAFGKGGFEKEFDYYEVLMDDEYEELNFEREC